MALNDVPQSAQTLGTTQPLIRNNFSTIDTVFAVDHVSYNTTGAGKHNKVTFPVQAPAPAFTVGEVGLYNFLNTDTGLNELYVTNSAGTSSPVTAKLNNANGWSYLPSGIIIQWGFSTSSTVGSTTMFPKQFPTSVFSVLVTQTPRVAFDNTFHEVRISDVPTAITIASFCTISTTTAAFYWFAIGI